MANFTYVNKLANEIRIEILFSPRCSELQEAVNSWMNENSGTLVHSIDFDGEMAIICYAPKEAPMKTLS